MRVYQIKIASIFLGLVCSTGLSCYAVGDGSADLVGYAKKHEVRLLWTADGWPDDVVGFRIGRRVDGVALWDRLGGGTIYPELSLERNWSGLGLSAVQSKSYQKKLKGYVEQGLLKGFVDHESFVKQLQQTGMRSGDRIRLKNDFDLAMVMGFGFIDSTIQSGESYEYGLFGVYAGGRESNEPLDTYIALYLEEEDERLKVQLNAEQSGSNVQLSWSSHRSIHDQAGLLTYNIYRKKNKEDEWVRIVPPFISPREKTDDALVWKYTDKDVDAYRSWYYAVAPLNKFQVEFGKSWVKYEPKEWAPAKISKLEVQDNRRIEIFWEIDQEMEQQVQGFRIKRKIEGEGEYTQLASALLEDGTMLPGGKRYLQDRSPVPRKKISYKIVMINKQGAEFESEAQSVYFKGPPVPDTPSGFDVSFIQHENNNYIVGTWNQPSVSNSVVKYRLFNNINLDYELLENGSLSLGRTNTYSWKIAGLEGNCEYRVGIQPVDKKNKRGERVEASVAVPRLRAPHIRTLEASYRPEDGNLIITWDYPLWDDLVGFRLYLDDELLFGEDTLTPHIRSWVIKDYPEEYEEHYRLYFEIEPVFPYCVGRRSPRKNVSMEQTRPDRNLPAPRRFGIDVKGTTEEGAQWIKLAWEKLRIKEHLPSLRGTYFQVSNTADFGDVKRFRVKPDADWFYYRVPAEWQGQDLFFRCSFFGDHPWGGLYVERKVSQKNREYNDTVSADMQSSFFEHNKKFRLN